MNKRVTPEKRCPECNIHKMWCICGVIKKCSNPNSFVSLIMHHRERALTSNTAVILNKCLENTQLHLRGQIGVRLSDSFEIKDGYQPLYLFPHDGAIDLTPEYLTELGNPKIQLIIPDGTWHQAQKIYKREDVLRGVPCVKLAKSYTSQYNLRKQSREGGVCTMEAGLYALGVIESNALELELFEIFKNFVYIMQASRVGCPLDRIKKDRDKDELN